MACWDIAANAAGLPLCDLLGGRTEGRVRLHSSIPSGTPAELLAEIELARDEGYHFHSAKVGADVDADIERMRFLDSHMEPGEGLTFDVNRAWLPAEAIAAAVHLAQATPEPFRRATWLCFDHLTVNPISGGVTNDGGWAEAPRAPGIGAEPDEAALGQPVAVYRAGQY